MSESITPYTLMRAKDVVEHALMQQHVHLHTVTLTINGEHGDVDVKMEGFRLTPKGTRSSISRMSAQEELRFDSQMA